jgi:hypothetical protein
MVKKRWWELFRYAAVVMCQAFELNSVFVWQGYNEILITLRRLVSGENF